MKKSIFVFLIIVILITSASMLLTASASRDVSGAKPSTPARKGKPPVAPSRQAGQPVAGQSSVLLPDGNLLLTGGERQGTPTAEAIIFDPQTGAAAPLPAGLRQSRAGHASTVLPDGTVIITGGVGADGQVLNSAELYDPATRSFAPLGARLHEARAYHTATLLTDGDVLLVGGASGTGRGHDAAELLDTRAMRFSLLPAPPGKSRRKHTATLQSDGRVLLWGGLGENETELVGDGEQFDPSNRSWSWIGAPPAPEDASPPWLASALPADGETDVPTDARIALRFSKPLRAGRVNAATVTLSHQQENVPAKVVAAEGGRLVFVTPAAPLLRGSVYTVNGSGLTDNANQPLSPFLITFTTAGDAKKETAPPDGDKRLPTFGDGQWNPGTERERGSWRSNRAKSPWQSLPPFQAAPGVTALAGQVLSLDGDALRNVTLRMDGQEAVTDSTGRFLLTGLKSGRAVLLIDGSTASTGARPVATFDVLIDIDAGRTNVLPFTVWLPFIDTGRATKLPVPTQRQLKAVTSLMPGLEVQIPADTVLRYPQRGHHHGMNSVDNLLTSLTITPMPADRPPFPLPAGLEDGLLFTLQLHGASAQGLDGGKRPGIRIVYPNYANLPAGSRYSMWNYDPTGAGWYVYGLGTVSPDGRQVIPDPGTELQSMYCVVVVNPLFGNGANAPGKGRPACGGCPVADPVDLYTGLFIYQKTDLAVSDDAALTLTRTYRQNDPYVRGFGIGTNFDFEMFVIGDNTTFQSAEVILSSGSRLKFKRVSFGAGGAGAVLEQTSAPGSFHKSTLRWNGARAPVGWDLITGEGTVYEFNNTSGKLQMVQDRNGNRLSISDFLLTTRITSSSGRWIELLRDSYTNRIIEAKDQVGRIVKYAYDTSGRLWKVTNPDNKVTEYTYDSTHRMVSVKDARGIVFLTNEYDITTGRVRKQIFADETPSDPTDNPFFLFNYTLDADGKATAAEVIDPRGNVRRVTFNSDGYLLTSTEAYGTTDAQTIVYERQAGTNLLLSVTDALSRKTAYTYDAMGNVTEVARLADTAQPVKTTYTYEPRYQRVATITDPLNHVVTITHDARGNVTGVKDHLNHEGTFTYDRNGRMLTASDPLGHTRQYSYDAGLIVKVRDPLGRSLSRFVDRIGRTTHVTDQLGQTGRIEYDNLNRPVRLFNTKGEEIALSYDENGNVLSVTDPRLGVVRYTYDRQDRVVTRKDGLLQDDAFEYDKNGNVTKATNRRGKVTRFQYDALDRLVFAGYGATGAEPNVVYESTVSYTYDDADRLTVITDSISGSLSFGYDDLDRLTSESSPRGTVGYTYDAAGRRATMNVPGQAQITYGYDAADRLTSITQGTSSVGFTYDAADRRTALHLPFGVSVHAEFDAASQLTGLTYKRGQTVLGDLFYEYDAAGRRTGVSGSFARVLLPQANGTATYDAANRLTQRGATAYTYDTSGNLLNDGTNAYTWDARDQLTSINGPGLSASFQYDAFGRRHSKTINGQTTDFLFDGNNVVQEQAGGALANILTGSLDEVFLRVVGTNSRTYLTDALGSTLALLDAAGAAQTQYTYDPFGQTSASGETNASPTQFAGRENDGTGLYYNRARYYSPGLQRFISEDPAGFAGGINPYAYAGNNPVSFTDPHGAWPTPDTALDIGFIGYDIYALARDGRKNLGTNLAALGLDVLCLVVPIATGGGAAYRGTSVVLMHAGSKRMGQASVKSYQTYTKTNPQTGEVYTGRTSGTGTPRENVARRDGNHHRSDEGFDRAVLDQSSCDPSAIRGREQQMIDYFRGQGNAADQINGISPKNPRRGSYLDAATREFGLP